MRIARREGIAGLSDTHSIPDGGPNKGPITSVPPTGLKFLTVRIGKLSSAIFNNYDPLLLF